MRNYDTQQYFLQNQLSTGVLRSLILMVSGMTSHKNVTKTDVDTLNLANIQAKKGLITSSCVKLGYTEVHARSAYMQATNKKYRTIASHSQTSSLQEEQGETNISGNVRFSLYPSSLTSSAGT